MSDFSHVNALSRFLVSPGHLAMAATKSRRVSNLMKNKEKDMLAREVMHKGLKTIDGSETLESAAHKMADSDIGVLPVVSGNAVVGVITDRDIVTRCLAKDRDYHSVKAADCMTSKVVCASEDSDLKEVSQKMVDQKISRVFIQDNQKRPVGLISVEDLVHHSDPTLFTKTISAVKS